MDNAVVFSLLLACIFSIHSGCSQRPKIEQQGMKEHSNLAIERETDNKMSNWNLTSSDAELYIGDLGVDQLYTINQVRSLATGSAKQALLPNGFPLIQAFPNPDIAPKKGGYVENVIDTALSFLGTPYVYGSNRLEPSSFDCSDFTRWVYLSALGMDLPWDARNQAAYVDALSKRKYRDISKARRGDLLFFTSFRGNRAADYAGLDASQKPITHLGIYLGDGKIIHSASKKTGGVRIDKIIEKNFHLQHRFILGGGVLD
ncbi:C40 family peptidase [Paenibacillus sp. V4I5]|uniref:C40 family peptidase n=1 Tax=Paenibacillus sp. V4I5 TaxID=3042306 RepID=UPI00278D61C7|nr:C40 family peptidase [Paenibacillus sp. V4I5]MDQ0917308.1 cell wall-associated NlpC family hydrolase [Paenibacillus sp. V4I5]